MLILSMGLIIILVYEVENWINIKVGLKVFKCHAGLQPCFYRWLLQPGQMHIPTSIKYLFYAWCLYFLLSQTIQEKKILCCCLCKYIKLVNIKDYFLLQASNINFYGILCVFPYLLMFEKKGDRPFILRKKMVHKRM